MMIPMFLISPAIGLSGGALQTRRAGRDRGGQCGGYGWYNIRYSNPKPTGMWAFWATVRIRFVIRLVAAIVRTVGQRCEFWGVLGPPVGEIRGIARHALGIPPHRCGAWRVIGGGGGQRGVFPGGEICPTGTSTGGRGSKSTEVVGGRCYDLRKIRKFWTRE